MSNIKTVVDRELEYFSYDTFEVCTKDVVLVCPRSKSSVGLDCHQTTVALQRIVDFLTEVMGLKLRNSWSLGRNTAFHSTIVIGYRRDEDLDPSEQNPSWVSDNTVKLPWDCLEIENKTITACTHELVHPFFKIFFYSSLTLLTDRQNEHWGEGFCDFLRIFVIDALDMNLNEQVNSRQYNWREDSFEQYMRNTERTGDHWEGYHKLALRLLNEFRRYRQTDQGREKGQVEALREFLQLLSLKQDLEQQVTRDYHNIL